MEEQAKLEAYRKKDNIVPPVVYQTWHTKDMHYVWIEQFRAMKQVNSHIEFKLFTDDMCREYIKDNFDAKILWAYDTLAPTAYKADLWRYCVLYKEGGVYLDIKLLCYEIDLLRKEEFLRIEDIPQPPCTESTLETYSDEKYYSKNILEPGIWQAVMATVAGNQILKQTIDSVVDNVFNNYYGGNALCITGPTALCRVADRNNIPTGEMRLHKINFKDEYIHVLFHDVPIVKLIDYYRLYSNHNKSSNVDHLSIHYSSLWKKGLVFKPRRIAPARVVSSNFSFNKHDNVLNICDLSNGLYLVEKTKTKLSRIDDITLVSTDNVVSYMSLFNNRTKEHGYVLSSQCNNDCAIYGFTDPKVYRGSLIFNVKTNGEDFTIYVPSMNINNIKSWVHIKSNQLSFFNIRDQEYCVTKLSPHIEIAKFTKSSSNPLSEQKTVFHCKGVSHVDWATNGINIGKDVWFLGRRTVRKRPRNLYKTPANNGKSTIIISYCYFWIVLDNSLSTVKRSCVFQPSSGAFHKVSGTSYDVKTNMISIDATSYDNWSKTLVFSKDSFDNLVWF